MKTCKRCKTEKNMDAFPVYDGHMRANCRDCENAKHRESRKLNPGKHRAWLYDWRKRNPEKFKANCKRYSDKNRAAINKKNIDGNLMRNYGLTRQQYDAMYVAQNGVCAICSKLNLNGDRLAVDHNHATNAVRQLLCRKCNTVLGLVNDNRDILSKAISYLTKHQTLAELFPQEAV